MSSIPRALFQSLVDQLPVSIAIYELVSREDMDFKIVYANEAASTMAGFDFNQLIGQNTKTVLAAGYEGNAAIPTAMMEALDTKQEVSLGLSTYVDEKMGAVTHQTSCLYMEDNHVALMTKTAEKVESLSQKLSIQKQMLEHGEQAGGLCTWIVHEETGETEFTQAYWEIHHFHDEEINAQNATAKSIARIHPEDQEKMETFRTQHHDTFPISASYRYLIEANTFIWLEDTLSKRLSDGKLIGITQDITERRNRELESQELNEQLAAATEELRASNEELLSSSAILQEKSDALEKALRFQEKVMETSPEIIYVYDLIKRQNVFANKSLFEEFGYSEADIQAMGDQFFPTIIHPEDLSSVFQHHGQVLPNLQQGQTATLAYRMRHQLTKEYIWLESTESIFEQDVQGNVQTIIGIARNIQVQKLAEARLTQANQELEQFVYSVSHDLRAPVRHIESYANQIKENDSSHLTEEGTTSLERVIYSAKRLGSMIDELLTYSRNRNTTPLKSWIDSKKLVSHIIEEFTHMHSQQVISCEVQDDLPRCFGDPGMMRQVWENLISNAIKYSSKKEETHIKIQAEEKLDEIIFSIHDKGAGFEQAYADKLFSVFQRLHTRREFPGHGIGLANVARMIQHHQGRIWGESILEEGASFYFSIPNPKELTGD